MNYKYESFLRLPGGDYQVEAWLVDGYHVCVSAGLFPRIIGGADGKITGDCKPFLFSKTLKDSMYKPSVTLDQLIVDSWSRSLPFAQVVEEASKHGFSIQQELVVLVYEAMNRRYNKSILET
jgi:hypothetical protein